VSFWYTVLTIDSLFYNDEKTFQKLLRFSRRV
jgi:hypothetical protein